MTNTSGSKPYAGTMHILCSTHDSTYSHLLQAQAHPEQTDLCAWAWGGAGAAHTGRRCCWDQAA